MKFTLPGMILYAAMALYLAATGCLAFGLKKTGWRLFIAGFAAAALGVALRWAQAGRVPMQSMFEVFLAMGMMAWPAALIFSRITDKAGEAVDPLLGALLLFPAGFIFDAAARKLPPALQHWIFGPHVAVYLAGYLFMFKAGAAALKVLFASGSAAESLDRDVWRLARAGFPFLTIGLALGAWWGKLAWGDYWNWDPKEMWALAMWLIYVAYFHFRAFTRASFPKANAAFAISGCVAILCTLLWANLARIFAGLHSYAS